MSFKSQTLNIKLLFILTALSVLAVAFLAFWPVRKFLDTLDTEKM